jgi:hypothetical protein
MDPRIQIRIHTKMSWIRNTAENQTIVFFKLSQNVKVKIPQSKINLACPLQKSKDYGRNSNMQSDVVITIANFKFLLFRPKISGAENMEVPDPHKMLRP